MVTNTLPDKCPACGGPIRVTLSYPHVTVFTCCNTYSHTTGTWIGVCDNSYATALKMREALTFYASAMASDIAYDGGAKARVALMPVV